MAAEVAADAVELIATGGVEAAMNQHQHRRVTSAHGPRRTDVAIVGRRA